MKKIKNVLIVAVLTAVMALNTGCGNSFNASEYVESFMVMLTQGDVSEYTRLSGITEEEAMEEYQSMSDAIKSLVAVYGVSDETKEKIANVYLDVMSKAKYTVQEAEKTDDGYDVDVEIEPITGLYDGLLDELQDEVQSAFLAGEVTEDEVYEWMFDKMADKIQERMDSLSYGDPQTVTFQFVKNENVYELANESELGEQIGEIIIDQSALLE